MDKIKKVKLLKYFNWEMLIIVAIAGCLLFVNTFTVTKINEMESARSNAVFLMDEIEFPEQEEFTEELQGYLKDSYKMIELYDDNFDLLFQIQFNDDYLSKADIKTEPELISLLKRNKEGQASIVVNEDEEDVYFKWITNNNGEERLLMVYSAIKNVKGLWLFSFTCWMIMILIFVLVIRLHTKSYEDKIVQYKSITNNFL